LVDGAGADQALAIVDRQAPGGRRTQTWHFASRAECLRCHNPWTGGVLGFALPQLNRNHRYTTVSGTKNHADENGMTDHQFRALAHVDILNQDLENRPAPKLAHPYDATAGINEQARAYLHVNCSPCHRENAGGSVPSQMLYDLPLKKTGMVGAAPTQGAFGLPGARVVAPGEPFRSVLFYRFSTLGQGHMPRLGSSMVDVAGANLLHDWILQLPKERAPDPDEASAAAPSNAETEAALAHVRAGAGSPPATRSSATDWLLASTMRALALLHEADRNSLPPAVLKEIVDKAGVHSNVLVRDLFERFVPEEKRLKKLGRDIKPEEILTLKGVAENGRKIFQEEGGPQCSRCHRVQGEGREFGPDLSQIGRKYKRVQLLEQILKPSQVIDPNYMTYLAETRDELVYSGFLVKKTAEEVWLKDANDQEIRLPARELKLLQPQQVSAMPEGLLQGLTAQAVADLLEYLTSLQ
ncbi:MAG: c-type cytochrome, partial [Chloroflexi bacterium]|nr:c-type cytochrome [Chloroflexota bacterium]